MADRGTNTGWSLYRAAPMACKHLRYRAVVVLFLWGAWGYGHRVSYIADDYQYMDEELVEMIRVNCQRVYGFFVHFWGENGVINLS